MKSCGEPSPYGGPACEREKDHTGRHMSSVRYTELPGKELDDWKQTEPDEQPEIAPVNLPDYEPYDERKLSARLAEFLTHTTTRVLVLETVEEWLADIEQEWRKTGEAKALEFANSLKLIREKQVRN